MDYIHCGTHKIINKPVQEIQSEQFSLEKLENEVTNFLLLYDIHCVNSLNQDNGPLCLDFIQHAAKFGRVLELVASGCLNHN